MHTILIIENNFIVSHDLATRLQNWGYRTVVSMGTGGDSKALIDREKPDLLLIDVAYPDDHAQIESMSRRKGQPVIPLVLLVSNLDEETVEKLADLEPLRCLIKPYRQYELKHCIRSALRQGEILGQLREARSVKADIEAPIRAVINQAGLGVVVLKNERVTCLNQAAAHLIDRSSEKMAGLSLDRLAEFFQISREEFRLVFRAEKTDSSEVSGARTFRFRSRSGERRWVELSAGPIAFPDSQPGWLLYLRDVTQMAVAETERQTREIQYQYAQKMEAVGALAGSLALEFNRMMSDLRAGARAVLSSDHAEAGPLRMA